MSGVDDLTKDKRDPVAGLSPGSQLGKDCVVGVLLRVEEAVEVVNIGYGLCMRNIFLFSETIVCRERILAFAHSRISQSSSLPPCCLSDWSVID